MNARELRAKRAELLATAQALLETSEGENRSFTEEENTEYDELVKEAGELEIRIKRLENQPAPSAAPEQRIEIPAVNKGGIGGGEEVEETRLFCNYLRTGEEKELQEMQAENRASNDTTMNITTAADGGIHMSSSSYELDSRAMM